jgi:hypothetical protein
MSIPKYPIHIPEEGIPAFKTLLSLGPDAILKLESALETTGPSLDHPSLRAVAICRIIQQPEIVDDVEKVLTDVIFPLRRAMRRYCIPSEQMIESLEYDLKNQAGTGGAEVATFGPEDLSRWSECKEAVHRLLVSNMMALESKSELLIEARVRKITDLNIYSEVIPVFDDLGERVRVRVLTNTLRIRFREGARIREESFSLDPAELAKLKTQVERAHRKNAVLSKGQDSDVPTLVVRSAEDESSEHQ